MLSMIKKFKKTAENIYNDANVVFFNSYFTKLEFKESNNNYYENNNFENLENINDFEKIENSFYNGMISDLIQYVNNTI